MGKHGKKLKKAIKKNREKLNSGNVVRRGEKFQETSHLGVDGDYVEIPGTSVTHQQVGLVNYYCLQSMKEYFANHSGWDLLYFSNFICGRY